MESWQEIGIRHGTDKAFGHEYMPVYENLLKDFPVYTVLEIGVQQGRSITMWEEIFTNALVIGVDIDPSCKHSNTILIADATDKEVMSEYAERYGPFDLIVDDGSHVLDDVKKSHNILRKYCTGFYIIEDLNEDYPYVLNFIKSINAEYYQTMHNGLIVERCYERAS